MRRWLALLLVVASFAGCSRNRAADGLSRDVDSTLHVENRHWGDVDVFVIVNGQRSRVGTVTATSDQDFVLRSGLLGRQGTLQLQAHGVGMSGTLTSETIAIRRGMQLNWSLEVNLTRASLSVY